MKILIGYDGSECADAAIDDLRRAGLPEKAEAQVLSVAEVWLPPPDPAETETADTNPIAAPMYAKARRAVQEAQNFADRGRARLSALFPSWNVSGTGTYGSPAWELVFMADKWQPDLVVVGSHGYSALGRFVLGSVSQVVLNEAQCSVRIARGRVEEPDTPVRVIVGLDGSAESQAAVEVVAKRTWPLNSQIKLVVVDDPVTANFVGDDFPPIADNEEDADRAWAQKILADSAALLGNPAGIEVTTELVEGNPKTQLLTTAEEWGADCIFVGSSGSSHTAARFLLGSVSAAVSSRAHCSVEVVRKKQ
ncbi:MAG TPA: universal stress protein [Pyrinomonadaceae bacterium]|nr:universal stress protein [Pyrinomonadaceae bacterium]